MTDNYELPNTQVKFRPLNDQVLVKLDTKEHSKLDVTNEGKPKVYPSGRVIAVGLGVYKPGVGFAGSQVQPGDHVALELDNTAKTMPISDNAMDCYVSVSESCLFGVIEGATLDSVWFADKDKKSGIITLDK